MSRSSLSRRNLIGGAGAVAAGSAMTPWWYRSAAAQEEVTLDIYVFDGHPFYWVQPLFEEAYPNIKLNMMGQSDMAVFRAALASGEGVPDINWPSEEYIQDLGRSDVLYDTTALIEQYKDELSPSATNAVFIEQTGRYAGFPGDLAPVGIYFREDLLAQAGVSFPENWTWDDYIAIAQEIDAQLGAKSIMLPTNGIPETMYLWSYILNQLGGQMTSSDGREILFDSDEGVAALEIIKKMYEADIHLDDTQFSESFFAEISAGGLAMCPLQVWYRNLGIEPNVFDEQSGLGQWRLSLLPSAGEGSFLSANEGGAAIISTIYTEHPEEVEAFMTFTHATMEGAGAMGDWGIVPPYLPYLESSAWSDVRSPAFGDFAVNALWTEAVNAMQPGWRRHAVYSEACAAIGADFMPMVRGEVDPATGLKEIGDQVRELNARYFE